MGDTTIMIGTKEISLSKALKYYDDPIKCQRKLDLTEKEYKSLLNKMIKRVQGVQGGPDLKLKGIKEIKEIPTTPFTPPTPTLKLKLKSKSKSKSNLKSKSRTLHVDVNNNHGYNVIETPREPVRFQPPIIQNDIMLPMPQPSYEAASNVNPVDGRTPIQAPLWFDMLAGDTKPSVENSKINNESIGHRQLSSQILPPPLKLESPRFQQSSQQFPHPSQSLNHPSQSLNHQHQSLNPHQQLQFPNPQPQYPNQHQYSNHQPQHQYPNHQPQHQFPHQQSMETDFQQPVQPTQPQFNPRQFRQQTAQSRSSNNLATSRVFDIGRTDFPAVISRVPHNTRIKTQKNDFS